ncbi:MAG: acyl dehydratase [Dehalococcoidia bacterium]|nr:acyl dehydratase [Dehalococcoidia bacterium]MCA9850652.1 acyl dehydratase [Dehalococcoidia bacterium]
MAEIAYWEDLAVGEEIPPFEITPTAVQLFQLSAVTWNSHRIHYDAAWAQHEGYEERVIHGPFQAEILVQTLQRWLGTTGWLKKLAFSNRRYAVLGETLTGRGHITTLREEGGNHFADLDVWVEKGPGQVTTPGTATVVLPTRAARILVPH